MVYEILDISGDVGIRAYGNSIEETFINAGIGMYSLITDIEKISEKKVIGLQIKGISLEGLLVSYLNELIYIFDAFNFIGKRIEIISSDFKTTNPYINIKVFGEEFNPLIHERKLLIKAATYHNIKIDNINGRWLIEVIFDI